MNLSEKKAYVMENLKYLPEFEKKAFDFNLKSPVSSSYATVLILTNLCHFF